MFWDRLLESCALVRERRVVVQSRARSTRTRSSSRAPRASRARSTRTRSSSSTCARINDSGASRVERARSRPHTTASRPRPVRDGRRRKLRRPRRRAQNARGGPACWAVPVCPVARAGLVSSSSLSLCVLHAPPPRAVRARPATRRRPARTGCAQTSSAYGCGRRPRPPSPLPHAWPPSPLPHAWPPSPLPHAWPPSQLPHAWPPSPPAPHAGRSPCAQRLERGWFRPPLSLSVCCTRRRHAQSERDRRLGGGRREQEARRPRATPFTDARGRRRRRQLQQEGRGVRRAAACVACVRTKQTTQ